MAFITWTDELSVGVREFDEQHRKLVGMINTLHDAMTKGKGREALTPLFESILEYTVGHFAAEEKLMKQYDYPEYELHLLEHHNLTAQSRDLRDKAKRESLGMSVEVLAFLKNWLTHHILETDKKYGPFLNGRGIQ